MNYSPCVAGVFALRDRTKNRVPALARLKRRRRALPSSVPPDDPLPPPLTPEELDALCDELFGVKERPQR